MNAGVVLSDLSDMPHTSVSGKIGLRTLVCGNAKKASIGFWFAHAHGEAVAAERAARRICPRWTTL